MVDVRKAEERDSDFKLIEKDRKEFRIEGISHENRIHLSEVEKEIKKGTEKYPLFIEEEHIIQKPSEPCEKHGKLLYHEGKEKWFCPFCND